MINAIIYYSEAHRRPYECVYIVYRYYIIICVVFAERAFRFLSAAAVYRKREEDDRKVARREK